MLIDRFEMIRSKKSMRFTDAKRECWENESVILANEWQKVLTSSVIKP
jgi:hypothetical protein